MTVNSKMTALADEIRELSGTTTPKSIDDMTSDVDSANTEVASQAELIAQITTALEGKASSSGGTILPTLDNPAVASDILSGKEAIDESGNKITGSIATKTSSNLTASGATVTVPAGYYASQATKSVATATQATPSVSIDANGKITASATQTAGYVTAGTKSETKQMTIQAAKTITPSARSQTAVAKNVYTTGAVTVAAIPGNYEDVGTETSAYTDKLESLETAIAALETELQGKASGGSSNGVEVEVITITETDTSQIPFTLKRVTKTIGSYNGDSATGIPCVGAAIISSHINTHRFAYSGNPMAGTYVNKSEILTLSSGKLVASQCTFAVPYVAVFINDPTQPAIYEE